MWHFFPKIISTCHIIAVALGKCFISDSADTKAGQWHRWGWMGSSVIKWNENLYDTWNTCILNYPTDICLSPDIHSVCPLYL